jgi:hypothetical protein
MTLAERIQQEKISVSVLLAGIFGPKSEVTCLLAMRLEAVLAEELIYDHRAESPATLQGMWNSTPSLADQSKEAPATIPSKEGLQGLSQATYAFRLLTLSHILVDLKKGVGNTQGFADVLSELGLGIQEIEGYLKDFVR